MAVAQLLVTIELLLNINAVHIVHNFFFFLVNYDALNQNKEIQEVVSSKQTAAKQTAANWMAINVVLILLDEFMVGFIMNVRERSYYISTQ